VVTSVRKRFGSCASAEGPLVFLDEGFAGVVFRFLAVERSPPDVTLDPLVAGCLLLVRGALEVVGEDRGRGPEPFLVELFLIGPHALVQLLPALFLNSAVDDLEHALSEKTHDLVVDLEVGSEEAQVLGAVEELEDTVLGEIGRSRDHAQGNVLAEG
jgi:hypothetical protein